MTGDTGGIPKPGGTVNPGPAAPPEAGGGLELAANTLPILTGGEEEGETIQTTYILTYFTGSQTSKFQGLSLTLTVYKWNQMDHLYTVRVTDL